MNIDEKSVKPIAVCMMPDMINALDKQAKEEGIYSRSAIIRRACAAYLQNSIETDPPPNQKQVGKPSQTSQKAR